MLYFQNEEYCKTKFDLNFQSVNYLLNSEKSERMYCFYNMFIFVIISDIADGEVKMF